jgi:hypothetical protein
MARRSGNESPFTAKGIDWAGASNNPSGFDSCDSGGTPGESWGPADAAGVDHLNKKANKRPDRESKYSNEKTVVDRPLFASTSRVKKNSATAYEPDVWYRGPKEG